LMAEWIIGGDAPVDLWDVDLRRFAPFHANRRHLFDRTAETLGLHYAMRWPREELATVRPLRRSPLYDRLKAKGAVFGSKLNWERANYFLPPGAEAIPYTMDTPGWLPLVLDEQRAAREDVVVFDQTSFAKFILKGRDAVEVLQRLCANEVDVPSGRMVYTAMLNERGGFESDLTLTRIADDTFFILTGSAQATRDADRIVKHIGESEFAALVDVTSAYSVLSVMGPKAAELLGRLSPDDLSRQGLPFSETREIDVGYARVRAARISYIGGPGYELYVTTDQCATLYDALHEAGRALALRDAGYYTIDALRIEAGRRAWGAELGPDETPFEARTMPAVRLDKADGFIGQGALVRLQNAPPAKRLVTVVLDSGDPCLWGGEALVIDGEPVGEISSAGWIDAAGRFIALGYVRGAAAARVHAGASIVVDVWGDAVAASTWDFWSPVSNAAAAPR